MLITKSTGLKTSMEFEPTLRAYSVIGELNTTQKRCLQKFINLCMKHGKKNKSYKIISNTLQRLSRYAPNNTSATAVSAQSFEQKIEDSRFSPATKGRQRVSTRRRQSLLVKAIENVKPIIEVKKVRISGTTQLVPYIIPKNRQICLALRWIIEAAILRRNTKKSMTIDQCFFAELIDASQNIGTVRKRRDDLHKLAESNRGFAHYRW
jgi:ribosomal protein S7